MAVPGAVNLGLGIDRYLDPAVPMLEIEAGMTAYIERDRLEATGAVAPTNAVFTVTWDVGPEPGLGVALPTMGRLPTRVQRAADYGLTLQGGWDRHHWSPDHLWLFVPLRHNVNVGTRGELGLRADAGVGAPLVGRPHQRLDVFAQGAFFAHVWTAPAAIGVRAQATWHAGEPSTQRLAVAPYLHFAMCHSLHKSPAGGRVHAQICDRALYFTSFIEPFATGPRAWTFTVGFRQY